MQRERRLFLKNRILKNKKMNLSKYLKIIIPTIIFYEALHFFVGNIGLSFYILAVLFIVVAISVFGVARRQLFPILPMMVFTASSVLFLLTLGKNNFQDIYITLSSLLFFFALFGLDQFFSQWKKYNHQEIIKRKALYFGFNIQQTIIIFSIFFLTSGIFGIYMDLNFPIWIVMVAIFIGTQILTLYLVKINFLKNKIAKDRLVSFSDRTFIFYSFLFGFLIAEIIWVINFSPANHLTVGSIVLCLYYFFWNILQNRFKNNLTKKMVVFNLAFLIIALSAILTTSKWGIV